MAIISDAQATTYYNSQPKKRSAASVLIHNSSGQLLLVKPNYLDRWLWPGGGVEEGESPLAAAVRECSEEIGVRPSNLQPAFVNYVSAQANGQSDIVHFVFRAPDVSTDFLATLTLQKDEIDDAKFIDITELSKYLSTGRCQAMQTYHNPAYSLAHLYMENGLLV